ncbi:GntR family transcriptional regulator [Niallia endozanthoxylica]|uniref:GntR family transcriptional regulator n=1 Tax=Niallia endozanthoxylica TaxID=2036016 RepID=A0A5J5I3T3_9BACI|nr:GntR family transcriptional regulator [Niallia endozanthoxylica]KAA9029976.1 GntR family transcriptional regulator [Niallia endozanthoxylica]
MIEKNSPIPIYYQLAELIQEEIESGNLQPGDALPSEREFAEKYQISRMTVRQALNLLENNGKLYRIQGKGTFVSEQKIEKHLLGLTSFTEDMTARGLKPSSRLLQFEIIPATLHIANQLYIKEYDPVYEIKRIRLADDVPMALETNYISANLLKGLTEQIINQSLYAYMEAQSIIIESASQTIESSLAEEMEANFLKVKVGAPVMLIQRNTFLQNGTPVELVKSIYRADRYKFTIQMGR